MDVYYNTKDERYYFVGLKQSDVKCKGNEKIIKIYAEKIHNCVKINVFNTGSGISEGDAENIFTSFYRADKAHSRKEGRFGLGLSIVKSIIDNHGCECGFENKENGVEFWFTMKLAPQNTETEG